MTGLTGVIAAASLGALPFSGSWMWVLAVGLALALAVLGVLALRKKRPGAVGELKSEGAVKEEPKAPEPEAPPPARNPTGARWDVRPRDLVDFFLTIYKVQLGVPQNAPAEVVPVEEKPSRGAHVFEFKVNRKGKWMSRRMSIRPIGEESKSRSRLYYVIFDAHLVVKVTQKPVTDFSRYLEQIKKEWAIARALAPRECVVPLLSVLLRLVSPMAAGRDRTVEEIEDLYIKKATHQTELRSYLKVGGSFLCFMELSTRFFLAEVLHDIHGPEDRLFEEMTACPEVLSDPVAGSGRYGEESLSACLAIQAAFAPCQANVAEEFRKLPGSPAPPFRLGGWFLECVAGRCPDRAATGLSEAEYKVVEKALKNAMAEHPYAVGSFTEAVSSKVRELSFSQSRPKLEGLIANLLDLLAWLEKSSVAARDLKPDNLLVVGDPARYPGFLTDPGSYEIGLIDLETAVSWARPGGRPPEQPPLAGTPLYATPAHIMENGLMEALFGDLGVALHMEDWHATVGMIYAVATGEPLFAETARRMPSVIQVLKSPVASEKDAVHFAREALRIFWESAFADFSEKTRQKAGELSALTIRPGKPAAEMLSRHLTLARDRLLREIEAFVESRAGSASPENRQRLLSADSETLIRRLKTAESDPAAAFLGRLYALRKREEAMSRVLAEPSGPLDAGGILEAMFFRVFSFLYDENWGFVARL